MKPKIMLSLMLIVSLFTIGCSGGDGKKGSKAPFNPSRNYAIEISFNTTTNTTTQQNFKSNNFATMGVGVMGSSVTKDPSWFKEMTRNDCFLSVWQGSPRKTHGSAWAYLRDLDTGEIVDLNDTEVNQFKWSFDTTDIEIENNIGQAVAIAISSPKVVRYTVTYTYEVQVQTINPETGEPVITTEERQLSANGSIIAIESGTIPLYNQGYVFATKTVTSTETADFWYSRIGEINYINAPNGVAFVLDRVVFEDLGGILRVPEGLTFTNQLPCVHYGAFIVKTRDGKYVKMVNFLDNSERTTINFVFEPPVIGTEFNLHW